MNFRYCTWFRRFCSGMSRFPPYIIESLVKLQATWDQQRKIWKCGAYGFWDFSWIGRRKTELGERLCVVKHLRRSWMVMVKWWWLHVTRLSGFYWMRLMWKSSCRNIMISAESWYWFMVGMCQKGVERSAWAEAHSSKRINWALQFESWSEQRLQRYNQLCHIVHLDRRDLAAQ